MDLLGNVPSIIESDPGHGRYEIRENFAGSFRPKSENGRLRVDAIMLGDATYPLADAETTATEAVLDAALMIARGLPAIAEYHDLSGKLATAEQELGVVKERLRQLDVDREHAMIHEQGEALAVRLGAIEQERDTLQARIRASEQGLSILANEVHMRRATLENIAAEILDRARS